MFVAELWGVLLGLKLVVHLQRQNMVLQIDSKAVVTAIKGNRWGCVSGRRLVRTIRILLPSFNHIRIHHHSHREKDYYWLIMVVLWGVNM